MRLRDRQIALGAAFAFALVVASCKDANSGPAAGGPKPPASPPSQKATMTDLTWSMKLDGTNLLVSYAFANHTDHVVYVNDGVAIQTQKGAFKSTSAELEASGDTLTITIGEPSGDVPGAVSPPGIYVAVKPGASFEGSRTLAVPLRRTDAMGTKRDLPKGLAKAALVIHAFDGEPPTWRELSGQDGKAIKVPQGFTPRNLSGGTQPLPAGAAT